ncbi:hypothetical protein [Mycolicibacterium sp.]|uniref:hypothetical protein n=1 Tax=Mycolicibacterium sp. TaxID=2320850 RepID=UPI0028AE0F1A|nr:hypothetical protein [Mycolicibacterium sp.]
MLGFGFFGMILAVIAGFAPRIVGSIELGKEGAKIPIGDIRRAEMQMAEGQVVGMERLPEVAEKIQAALADEKSAVGQRPSAGFAVEMTDVPRRTVVLTDDAAISMAKLSDQEQDLVNAELSQLSDPEIDPRQSDIRAPGAEDSERTYYVRRVGPDISLWYRLIASGADDQTETLAVMVVTRSSADLSG